MRIKKIEGISYSIKLDEKTWLLYSGLVIFSIILYSLIWLNENIWPSWVISFVWLVVWLFFLSKAANSVLILERVSNTLIFERHLFLQKPIKIKCSLEHLSSVTLNVDDDGGSTYSISVSIKEEQYDLFNHFTSQNAVKEAYYNIKHFVNVE